MRECLSTHNNTHERHKSNRNHVYCKHLTDLQFTKNVLLLFLKNIRVKVRNNILPRYIQTHENLHASEKGSVSVFAGKERQRVFYRIIKTLSFFLLCFLPFPLSITSASPFHLEMLALKQIVLLFGDHHAVVTTSQLVENASEFFVIFGSPAEKQGHEKSVQRLIQIVLLHGNLQ